MTTYIFKTREFGISDDGVHLLRSGFNYKTIAFSDLKKIKIENGKELHNWWLVFALGAMLIVFGVYLSIGTIKILIQGDIAPRNAKMIFLLLIPVVGGYFVYNSFKAGLVLKIHCVNGDKNMFPLREIVKSQKLNELKTYLRNKLGTSVQVAT